MKKLHGKSGFTLIELLIVIMIIGVLVSLIIPAAARARESARKTECKNNLHNFGIGFYTFAERDPQRRLCTGASDFRRDGCMDQWGWVADLVKLGAASPGDMLCPTNPIRGPEKLNDLLGKDTTDAKDGAPLSRLNSGVCGSSAWSGLSGGGGTGTFADTAPNTAERAALVARAFLNRGINTNYAAGWHFVRQSPKFNFDDSTTPARILAGGVAGSSGLKGLSTTTGPLTMRMLDSGSGRVTSAHIALLGDAAAGDVDEALLAQDLGYGPQLLDGSPDPFANGDTETKTFLSAGELLSEAFNDGPAYFDPSSNTLNLIEQGADLTLQASCEIEGGCPPAVTGSGTYLQDTRDWYAVHGGGGCNVLMADGHVRQFNDDDGDGFLNPGFQVPDDLSPQDYAPVGYSSSVVEMPPTEIFNGVFVVKLGKRSVFE